MKFFIFLVVMFFVLDAQVAPLYAADAKTVQIVLDEDNSFIRNIASSLARLLKQTDPGLGVETTPAGRDLGKTEPDKRILVLIGERAVAHVDMAVASGSPVLALAPQRSSLDVAGKRPAALSILYFEQPLPRLLNLAGLINSAANNNTRRAVVGIIASDGLRKYLSGAEAAADERKQKLQIETVDNELAVGRATARVAENSSMLLAIPDPLVQTANTVQPILLLTYHAGIPVIGYSAAYLRAGAAVALYSTPEQLAQQAAETVAAYLSGKAPLSIQKPRYFTVGVNTTVARSLGIELPGADAMEEKLRSMKE